MCEADRRQNHQRETRQQAEVLPLSDEGAIWARPRPRATVASPAAPDMYGHLCSQSAPQAANPGRLFGAAQSQCEPGGEIASTPGTGPHWFCPADPGFVQWHASSASPSTDTMSSLCGFPSDCCFLGCHCGRRWGAKFRDEGWTVRTEHEDQWALSEGDLMGLHRHCSLKRGSSASPQWPVAVAGGRPFGGVRKPP